MTDKDRHSTRANSKVSDPSKPELIHTSCRSESSNISLVVLDKDSPFVSALCHSCWMESRIKEVAPDRAGISRLIDLVKAIADSDVTLEEHE